MTTPVQARKILFQQGVNGALVQHPAEDVRLSSGGGWTPDPTDPLKVRSGVVAGSGPSATTPPCTVTASAGQVTVSPGRFVVQGSTALQGHYEGTVDQAVTRTMAQSGGLPGAGQFKAGRVVIRVYDQLYGDAQDGWKVEVVLGAAASTVGAAAQPVQPPSSLLLRSFTVDSAGAITLASSLSSLTVPRGGVLPIQAWETAEAGAYVDQYRGHPVRGLQRWNGATWGPARYGTRASTFTRTGLSVANSFTHTTWVGLTANASNDAPVLFNSGTGIFTVQEAGEFDIRYQTYSDGGSGGLSMINFWCQAMADTRQFPSADLWDRVTRATGFAGAGGLYHPLPIGRLWLPSGATFRFGVGQTNSGGGAVSFDCSIGITFVG